MDRKVAHYLNQLLAIFWLRPETALWRALDCGLMHGEKPQGRGADLGCGTGLLSYVMAGGKVSGYDDFLNTSNLGSFRKGADIYNSKAIVRPTLNGSGLRYTFDYAVDHKKGLLDKAAQFKNFYKQTHLQDLNKPLPFPGGYLDWGFSNILYWLENVPQVLKGWSRAIRKSGKLYLFVPNQHFKEKAWLYYKAPHKGEKAYLNYFDRGYNSLIHHYYSQSQWESLFRKGGFRVLSHKSYLSNPVMEIWNIGTRPISHLLIDMASHLRSNDRKTAKEQWIKYFSAFFMPILQKELAHRQVEKDCAFHFFVLENKS